MAEIPSELRLDAVYRNTNNWKSADDVFNRFFRFSDGKGINNVSGFRPKSRRSGATDPREAAFTVLVTNLSEPEWPDRLDPESGLFTYYGDNREPGRAVADTEVGGNRLLEHVFRLVHTGRQAGVQPFLAFQSLKRGGLSFMRFLGLACPGGEGLSALEDLVGVWRVKSGERFQNYRALFTILDAETVSHEWLENLVNGMSPAESIHCPKVWRDWVDRGTYSALRCERPRAARTRKEQLPAKRSEWVILERILGSLSDREFEFAARDLVQLMDSRFTEMQVTRAVRDGGRDVIARVRLGHEGHQALLTASIEAKRWDPRSAVGVKPVMRLLSRLKYRDIGVFVTTSFFDRQVQEELIEDDQPVILVSGGDLVRLLVARELADPTPGGKLEGWLESVRTRAASFGQVARQPRETVGTRRIVASPPAPRGRRR